MNGFDNYYSDPVASYSKLRLRFPYTTTFISQDLPRQRLQPGQEYAIWFAFNESKLPDIAFALTIRSDNGYKHFGILPMQ